MQYIAIWTVNTACVITHKNNFLSAEKAVAFFDNLCQGGETVIDYGSHHKRVKHKDGTSHTMHTESITFRDE